MTGSCPPEVGRNPSEANGRIGVIKIEPRSTLETPVLRRSSRKPKFDTEYRSGSGLETRWREGRNGRLRGQCFVTLGTVANELKESRKRRLTAKEGRCLQIQLALKPPCGQHCVLDAFGASAFLVRRHFLLGDLPRIAVSFRQLEERLPGNTEGVGAAPSGQLVGGLENLRRSAVAAAATESTPRSSTA